MFCHHCGQANPADSSFCGACGKSIAWTPAPNERSDPNQHELLEDARRTSDPGPRTTDLGRHTRDRWRLPNWLGVTAGIAILLMVLPHKDGSSVCDAAHNEVAQQVPFAVEILAARHPLTVGLVRAATKESSFVDQLAGIYVQNEMIPHQDAGAGSCYIAYYTVMLQKDRVRASIADWLEAKAKLK